MSNAELFKGENCKFMGAVFEVYKKQYNRIVHLKILRMKSREVRND